MSLVLFLKMSDLLLTHVKLTAGLDLFLLFCQFINSFACFVLFCFVFLIFFLFARLFAYTQGQLPKQNCSNDFLLFYLFLVFYFFVFVFVFVFFFLGEGNNFKQRFIYPESGMLSFLPSPAPQTFGSITVSWNTSFKMG